MLLFSVSVVPASCRPAQSWRGERFGKLESNRISLHPTKSFGESGGRVQVSGRWGAAASVCEPCLTVREVASRGYLLGSPRPPSSPVGSRVADGCWVVVGAWLLCQAAASESGSLLVDRVTQGFSVCRASGAQTSGSSGPKGELWPLLGRGHTQQCRAL